VQLADEFFLISWDTAISGSPILNTQATSLGLAGALLGELTLHRRVAIRGPQIWVADRTPLQDPLLGNLLELMNSTPEHSDVRTWLAYLAHNSVDAVVDRLVRAGLVRREESRSMLLRKSARYMATDYAKGAWPIQRIEILLSEGRPMTPADMVLVSLIEATGLLDTVISHMHDRRSARRYLATLMATLPAPLRDLAGHVQAAVGDAVLSYRS
jgi:hypothetical protein